MKGAAEMKVSRTLISILIIAAMLPAAFSQGDALNIAYTDKDITADPLSNIWIDAKPIKVNLGPQKITAPNGGKDVSIEVRGLHNGKFIGFFMEWPDATKDTVVQVDGNRDGAALQFPLDPAAQPSPFMGNPGVVNIWFWRGDWQGDLEGGEDLETTHPSYGGGYFPQDEELFLKAIRGGNIIRASPVEDLNAMGFGTLTTQEHQDVAGKGVYSNGKWKTVFVRPMVTSDEFDAQFTPGMNGKINFAIWDGSDNQRGAQKSVALIWTDMTVSGTGVKGAAPVGISAPAIVAERGVFRELSIGLVLPFIIGLIIGAIVLLVFKTPRSRDG